jgi:hypothetical protein
MTVTRLMPATTAMRLTPVTTATRPRCGGSGRRAAHARRDDAAKTSAASTVH